MRTHRGRLLAAVASLVGLLSCGASEPSLPAAFSHAPCDPGNAGLSLPPGFCASLVAEKLGAVRHLAVASNGDVFAAVRGEPGLVALRDTDGDGKADLVRRFGPPHGQGLVLTPGHLYLGCDDRVVRWPWKPGRLEPAGEAETIVRGFPRQGEHAAKAIALGPERTLFVNVGAPSNSCQVENRAPRSPGLDPCPQLRQHAGVWRFASDRPDQEPSPAHRFASGMRHTLALSVQPETGRLFGAIHGRDMLSALWGFSDEQNAELPAEEFVRIAAGEDYGWPYCYYDGLANRKVLAPEYGGDGTKRGRCREMSSPLLAFPAHWAPMALAFYGGTQFGPEYRGGAFLAFHGSWNRAPLPQEGYRVVFVPFRDGEPVASYSTFASAADGATSFRPSGLAVGPEGSLYIAADANEAIWRVRRE